MKRPTTIGKRLLSHIIVNPVTRCWEWQSDIDANGYGRVTVEGKTAYAHRVSYTTWAGPIPPGLVVDHVCRVRHCINPAHLEAVTNTVNTLRGTSPIAKNARKTHCPQGHPYTGSNLRVNRNRRYCVACQNERNRQRRRQVSRV